MQFRVLGPVEVHGDDGTLLPPLPPKAGRILAVLAADCGRVVPVDRLIDLVWGERPPPQARKSLQVHISGLRRAGVPIEHRTAGYRLDAEPDQVDAHLFRCLVARAGETADPVERRAVLGEALSLWRGAPMAGIDRLGGPLEAQRLAAVEDAVDADLALGHHAEVVDLLSGLVEEHPLSERLRLRLMRALAGSGRRTEAMKVFQDTRRLLVDELGVEPGPQLQQLYRAVLEGDEPEAPVRRNYLPRDVGDFTGRAEQLARLTDGDPHGVWWIEGAAGVGKSALAVHAAHRLAARYPDGQLFVDLHALPPSPGAALDTLLRAIDVPSVRIPAQLDERAALWRAQLTGRRVLIVLDGVTSVAQVRRLLPGSPGCLTLITSRLRPADRQAQRLTLDVLTSAEAVALLADILGDDRVAEEPEAALEVARLCGHLPLAVRITGARLAGRPHWPVSRLVSRLRDERGRLDELVADDLAVRSSLELTFRALDDPARRAYRAFGFLDHPELPAELASPLLGLPEQAAEDVLERLVDARLLDVTGRQRYRMHDLVRIHARELAEAEVGSDGLAAVRRVAAECLSKVDGCVERLMPAVGRMQGYLGELHDHPVPPEDRDAWFAAEEQLLIKVVERAAELGFAAAACDLAEALVFAWFGLRNRYDGWERTHRAALDAVVAAGDRRREAVLRCSVGQLHFKRDEFTEAGLWFGAAGALFVELGDRRGEAVALNGEGMATRERAQYHYALTALHRARDLLAELGDGEGVAHSLYGIGSVQRELALDEEAWRNLRAAETAYRVAGSRRGEVLAVRGIGLVHRARGEYAEAEPYFRRAHDIALALGDPLVSCYTAQSLAKAWLRTGRRTEAAELLAEALPSCRELGDRFGLALLRRTIGELHLAGGEAERAIVVLNAALAGWDELDLPAWRARTLRDLGAAHAAAGDDSSAARCWSEAALLLEGLGSREADESATWARWGYPAPSP